MNIDEIKRKIIEDYSNEIDEILKNKSDIHTYDGELSQKLNAVDEKYLKIFKKLTNE